MDDSVAPRYAILSHTWEQGEVTLQDVQRLPREELETRPGWRKVVKFCATVRDTFDTKTRGLSYGWVDTCCIDKTNGAELSEAINSMFRWYRNATTCVAYLSDVVYYTSQAKPFAQATLRDDFDQSRWFTRGWTLQELLAPQRLHFFDKDWLYLTSKTSSAKRISQITGISSDAIRSKTWTSYCISERMSWAAHRQTTRQEDMAYCLLGIFDISMPLLYGEGGDKAFLRLQEEIMKESDDQSIFAWDATSKDSLIRQIGALATSPSQFKDGASIEVIPSYGGSSVVTARGIQVHFPIVMLQTPVVSSRNKSEAVVVLSCRYVRDMGSLVGISVRKEELNLMTAFPISSSQMDLFSRLRDKPVSVPFSISLLKENPAKYLVKRDRLDETNHTRWRCWLDYSGIEKNFVIRPPLEGDDTDWTISSGSMIKLLASPVDFPTPRQPQPQPVSLVVSFAHRQAQEEPAFSVSVRLTPVEKRTTIDAAPIYEGHVGLKLLDQTTLSATLPPQLKEQELGLATTEKCELQIPRTDHRGHVMVWAKISVFTESWSTVKIMLTSSNM